MGMVSSTESSEGEGVEEVETMKIIVHPSKIHARVTVEEMDVVLDYLQKGIPTRIVTENMNKSVRRVKYIRKKLVDAGRLESRRRRSAAVESS